ncbi:glutamine synthetase/guanido kinase [Linnemannia elongata AG-77]|uniref:Glutamine synthetase/guanido kinase n=1 Tax=Linnemannia elongata AG-77 TaxID=1314771 RepID=A0A197JC76_9FUNG|nr:glutamine synthetase/guanido kinase [Linnemannia elongata AG-77]
MNLETFNPSKPFTFGIELEIQIVNTHDYDLTKAASDLMRLVKDQKVPGDIKLEITESMIELATVTAAEKLNIGLCGGGTHAFQQWSDRQISDEPRFHYISELYASSPFVQAPA